MAAAGAIRPCGPGAGRPSRVFRYVVVTTRQSMPTRCGGALHFAQYSSPDDWTETIRAAPKVLLHDHLDGGLRPPTVIELARETGYCGLPTTDPDELGRWLHCRRRPQEPRAVPRGLRAHRRRDADARGHRARRRRVCRGPRRRRRRLRRGALRARAAARRAGCRSTTSVRGGPGGVRARRGRGPASRWASSSPRCASSRDRSRSPSWRSATATRASSASTSPVRRPASRRRRYLDAFNLIHQANFHLTIHAGEAFGLPSIWEALQWCGAERLGHGVRIVDDITVGDDGRDRRWAGSPTYVRDRASAARDVPDLQRPHRRGRLDRGASDRPAAPAALPRHGQHRQPADERRDDERRVRDRCRASSASASTRCSG